MRFLIAILLTFLLVEEGKAQQDVLENFLLRTVERTDTLITQDSTLVVDTLGFVPVVDTTWQITDSDTTLSVVIDTVEATPVESQEWWDGTGYRIYAQGTDTLTTLISSTGDIAHWQAFIGDSVFVDQPTRFLRVHKIVWDAYEEYGSRLTNDLDTYARLDSVYKSGPITPPLDPDPNDEPEVPLVSWQSGDPLNLGPVPTTGEFRVETEFTLTAWDSWMRIVGKSEEAAPGHYWVLETNSAGAVIFRVRIDGAVQSVNTATGIVTLNNPVEVVAEYTLSELVLTVNGVGHVRDVGGTRNDDPTLDAWVWLSGAPDTRVLEGSVLYVRIYD